MTSFRYYLIELSWFKTNMIVQSILNLIDQMMMVKIEFQPFITFWPMTLMSSFQKIQRLPKNQKFDPIFVFIFFLPFPSTYHHRRRLATAGRTLCCHKISPKFFHFFLPPKSTSQFIAKLHRSKKIEHKSSLFP